MKKQCLDNKEWLHGQYIIQRKSIRQIAKENNCGSTTVNRYLTKHNILSRNLSEAKLGDSLNLLNDYDWLYDQYSTQRKTPETIAKENNIGRNTVVRYLIKHNISLRDVSEAKLGDSLNLLTDYNWMYDNYVIKQRTLESICDELECSSTALIKYLDSHSIERRGVSESCMSNVDGFKKMVDKEWLLEKYKTLSSRGIGEELGVNSKTVLTYLKKHGIEIDTNKPISKLENKIRNFLDDNNISYIASDREQIKPLELDIFIPDKMIAIEINGVYWHSEIYKSNDYHETKRLKCSDIGIRLINLYEDDINDKWDLLQRFLLNALGVNKEERIFARKCDINYNPDISECKELLNRYHIQGYASQNKALTLQHENETVAVMLFKGNVLTRYATSKKVIGGFGKLLKASGFEEIITFIDLDTFQGDTYFKTGFAIDCYLKPDYKYVVNAKRIHKFNFRLKKFREDPNLLYEEGLTEKQLAKLNNIPRIYDSGKYRLKWTKQK